MGSNNDNNVTYVRQVTFRHDRRGPCAWLLNIVWLLLGGWHLALAWFTTGCLLCLTCIGIPCGWQVIKISWFLLFPFGKRLVYTSESIDDESVRCCTDSWNCLFNILWAVTVGWILALQAILTGILFFITIIGIPFGISCFQLAYICFRPFGVDFTAEEEVTVISTTTTTSAVVPTGHYYQHVPV
jgi:uncharacterized membrane protein YccF (DUF307 family)